ncbi:CUB and sushi domain-containing protein 1-like [Branchiostoma floridae x Branchiostoma japonicum]
MKVSTVLALLVILVLLVPGPLGWRRRRRRRCWRNCSFSSWSYIKSNCTGECGGTGRITYQRYVTVSARCGGSCSSFRTKYEPCIGSCNHGTWISNSGNGYCECEAGYTGTCCESVIRCPALDDILNGGVSSSANHYGATVTMTCNPGYRLHGNSSTTCAANGHWDQTSAYCEEIRCRPITPPDYATMTADGNSYGDVVTFTCNNGYQMAGSSRLTCGSSGRWSSSPPTCNKVSCSDLPEPTHGSVTGGNTFQDIKTFSCDAGYRLEGSTIRECSASGTWTGSETVCNLIQCSQLNPPTHGSMHGGNYCNDIVYFSCDIGHALIGSSNRTCQESGLWTGTQPTCTAQECPDLDTPLNGQKTGGTAVGSFLIFFCNEGYDLTGGDMMRTCQSDQTWSGTAPTCERKSCPELPHPLNGNTTRGGHFYGDVAMFTCAAGYELTGSETMTCQSNGQWSGLQPLCSRVQCPTLSPIANGQMSGGNLFGQLVNYVCNSGYRLVGSSSRKCQADRSWSGTQASCALVECASPKAQPNSDIVVSGTSYGETVTSTCYPGYELSSGDTVRTCEASGRWTGTPPVCEKVCCDASISVDNGYLTVPSGYCFDSTIQIHCDLGYELVGDAGILHCNASGLWEGEEPKCEKITCGDPGDIRNGRKVVTGTLYGDIVTYSCDPGFILVGNDTYTCDAEGDWGPAPFCEAHSLCDRTQLATPGQGSKICFNSPDGVIPVEYCQIHCNPGYMYSSTEGMYECSVETSWRWQVRRTYSGLTVFNIIPVGDCSPGLGLLLGMTVEGFTITAGEPLDMEAIKDEMIHQLDQLHMCTDPCEIGEITVEISPRKRSGGIQYRMSVQFRAYADPTLVTPTNTIQMEWVQIVGELRQKATELQTLIQQEGLVLSVGGQALFVADGGITISNPSMDCREGQIKQGLNCFPCGTGTYHDVYQSICRPCEYATYQDEFGQTECKPCPDKTTTEGPGSKNISDCKSFADCNCGANPCILNSTGYFCHCLPGYEAKEDDCIDIDECADPDICPNALCMNRPGTYSCQCLSGYEGPFCADIDECRYGNYCPDHSTCTNTEGDYYCTCEQGYQGDNCEDIDECGDANLNTCRQDQICVNTDGSYHCDDCTVYNGKCYIVSDTMLNFAEAKMKCTEQGGIPVIIEDQQMQEFLVQELSVSNKDVWIGLTDLDVEGQFVWTDGSPLAYSNWAPGEPNGDHTKNCVHMWPLANFRWDDMPCGRNNYYVCQYNMA